jgi:predicted Rossmann fold nucleotide-binding protein DprA/Smf involved in DNA uptake
MSKLAVAVPSPASHQGIYCLALSLTAGPGPSRIKKLIDHHGTAERVFRASVTELLATGMRAVSAQAIATGKSLELAQPECAKATEAGARIIALGDPEYPSRLQEIYDPPVILLCREASRYWRSPELRWPELSIRDRMEPERQSVSRPLSLRVD